MKTASFRRQERRRTSPSLLAALLSALFAVVCAGQVLPARSDQAGPVDPATMQRIYDEVKTPFKYGVVLRGTAEEKVDCPSVFRHAGRWYMIYIAFDGSGYETRIARSDDLLAWTMLGPILTRHPGGWDAEQSAGGVALIDHDWNGTWELEKFDGKYWLSYLGGKLKGYETPPLSVGLAWTKDPAALKEWTRLAENPVLTPDAPDARPFEQDTLFKSHILRDPKSSIGWPFVMFYNARQKGVGTERIGMAVSKDMVHWQRYGHEPVIDNGPKRGISGDPQIVRIGDVWVMFYFGAFWRPDAFDTFACSRDLVHWTKWTGSDLIAPSEPWDKTYAHKPWVLRHDGVVYHFYCAVGDQGRVIALATSKPLPAKQSAANPPTNPPSMHWADSSRLGRPFSKDPSVIQFGGRYLMYFSLPPFDAKLAPPKAPKGWSIGIAASRDLVTWEKIGELLPEQECDRNGLCAPGAVVLDGKVHLFYQTYGNGPRDAICHAVSDDGIRFVRDASNPVFSPAGPWTAGRAIDADAIPFGGQLLLFFATRDPAMKVQMLGVAGADLKSDYSRSAWKQLGDGPILKPELPWEKQCIEAASLLRRGDTLYLFYAGGYNNEPQQIGCATSTDGLHWTRLFREPLLPNGPPGSWNASESGHPGIFRDHDGRTYLFFQGNPDKGKTWFLSAVELGWKDGVPSVLRDSPKFPLAPAPDR